MRIPLALLLLLAPTTALGHSSQTPNGVDWSTRDGLGMVETTVGVLLSDTPGTPSDSWRWMCHEALSTSDSLAIPRYTLVPGGMLAAIFTTGDAAWISNASVYRSDDGCEWAPPVGLDDQLVAGLSAQQGTVMAVTANLQATNTAFLSTDAGRTFQATALTDETRALQGVGWAASERVLVGAAQLEPFQAYLLFSDDDGATWVERELPGAEEPERPVPFAAHPTDPDTFWLLMDGFTGDRVIETADAGVTWTELLAVAELELLDATVLDDELLVTASDGTLWRGTTGQALQLAPDTPALLATAQSTDGVVYVGDTTAEEWLTALSAGGGVAPTLRFDQVVGPIECPAGSRTANACDPFWEGVGTVIGAIESETIDGVVIPPQEEPGPCGGSAALLPLLLPLGMVRRRV